MIQEKTNSNALPMEGLGGTQKDRIMCRSFGDRVFENREKMVSILTYDLRYFIDMVFLYATQHQLFPSYINRDEFRGCIDEIRRFDKGRYQEIGNDTEYRQRLAVTCDAYVNALIVYGYVKELALKGHNEAAASYERLKDLMPFKIC